MSIKPFRQAAEQHLDNSYLCGSRAPEVFVDSTNQQWRRDTCLHHQVG